jgi:nucleoid DNA-binding protein
MNKADLTDDLAKKTGLPKIRAAVYVNHLMDSIQDALTRGEKVTISDFGMAGGTIASK